MKKFLITGCAGFIGMHLCKKLLKKDCQIIGLDNLNSYYSVKLKKKRLMELSSKPNFEFIKVNILNKKKIREIFKIFKPEIVVNLAAQAGVPYSLEDPESYIKTNIMGFFNILECCKDYGVDGLIYASSSSIYGGNIKTPFSIEDKADSQLSVYGASKKNNENLAYVYSNLYGLNITGLRFFTVYGPWGRPDMAMNIFADKIINNHPIPVFNYGNMKRDFTYIDDIINGIVLSIEKNYKSEIFNLGNNKSISLLEMIQLIELNLGKKAKLTMMKHQQGDVKITLADIQYSQKKLGYEPLIGIKEGIYNFIQWFKSYNRI